MSITDYASLQTAVLSYLNRSGDADAVAQAPLWIQLAEDELRLNMNRLMVRQGETRDTSVTISTEYTALPSGFIRQRYLRLEGNPPQFLDYVAPQAVERWTNLTGQAAQPKLFTIQGNQLRVIPAPDASYATTFGYYTLPSLSNGTTTNWLITAHPKIYLKASLAEAFEYYRDDDGAMKQRLDMDRLLTQLSTVDGSDAQGSALRIRVDSSGP